MEYLSVSEIENIMQRVVNEILIPKFFALGLNASGNWIEELEVRVDENRDRGLIYGAHYTQQLVSGRKGGSLPPVSQLIRWAEVKLGLTGEDAVRAGWAISKKIEKEGTDIYQEGGTDLLEVLSSQETIDFVNSLAAPIIRQNIQINVNREFNKNFRQ